MTTTDPKLIEPVAWMYSLPDGECYLESKRNSWAYDDADGWIETPLYTAAAINEAAQKCSVRDHAVLVEEGFEAGRQAERAGIVAIMRDAVRSFCDGDGYFLAGQISVRLDAIERGEHLPPPPAIEAKESQHGDA